jgi:hypothetical protein
MKDSAEFQAQAALSPGVRLCYPLDTGWIGCRLTILSFFLDILSNVIHLLIVWSVSLHTIIPHQLPKSFIFFYATLPFSN